MSSVIDYHRDKSLSHLRKLMQAHFSLEELRVLCFDLAIDYDELGEGLSKSAFIVRLLQVVVRHAREDELLAKLRQCRPQVAWPSDIPIAIGALQGNVLRVNERIINDFLRETNQPPLPQPHNVIELTDFIKVFVLSNRFGRKVQFEVPHDMPIHAFIRLVVSTLRLPWSKSVSELSISFEFRYSILIGEKEVPREITLKAVGIEDGDELQLLIASAWKDELEIEEGKVESGSLRWNQLTKKQEIVRREEARKARGALASDEIELLINNCFTFVDRIGIT